MSIKGYWNRVAKHPAYRDNLSEILAHSKKRTAEKPAEKRNKKRK